MGRLRVFFCASCFDVGADQSSQDATFDRDIDVSHLATPHIPSNPSPDIVRSSPIARNRDEENSDSFMPHSSQQSRSTPNSCAISSQQFASNQRDSSMNNNHDVGSLSLRPPSNSQHEDVPSQASSPAFSTSAVDNIYEEQDDHREPSSPEQHQRQPFPPPRGQTPPPVPREMVHLPGTNGSTAKLSYDIISVREPLAKILAERQQLLQAQQHQRLLMGDHDYIEVYGERGSSCFYEEIAGSVASSATYDQIGSTSNHNYQVLVSAYAVANRQQNSNQDNDNNRGHDSRNNVNQQIENDYDVTSHPTDQIDGLGSNSRPNPANETGIDINGTANKHQNQSTSYTLSDSRAGSQLTQSIPVYSVINKATRRSSSNMRPITDSDRPPKPPPKNLSSHSKPQSNSATNHQNEHSHLYRSSIPSHIPSTSHDDRNAKHDFSVGHRHARLPQPPPRFSKQSAYNNANDRPLPSPNSNFDLVHNNNNGHTLDRNINSDEDDNESLDNGYELLNSNNIEDDQIDVGYEKIKEPYRYSGGSISSQLYHRQLIDNGGYESVQPIYSSPSNALVEPNYEAIAPTTASALAAAATAKLNAVSVIEQVYQKNQ